MNTDTPLLKIIHTSDWHLGQSFYNHDRLNDSRNFLSQLADAVHAEQPDALLVSGDVFDVPAPGAAAQRLYCEALLSIHDACPGMSIIVTAGNHDSASRLEASGELWRRANVTVLGGIHRKPDSSADFDSHILPVTRSGNTVGYVAAVPFAYAQNFPAADACTDKVQRQANFFSGLLGRVAEINTGHCPVVVMAHIAVTGGNGSPTGEIGNIDCVPLSTFGSGYDYLALGHIHQPHTMHAADGSVARYCGSPIALSFDEDYQHSVTVASLSAGRQPQIREIAIAEPVPLITVPQQPVEIAEALAALNSDIPDDKPCYVRLNVKTADYIPGNSYALAQEATASKAAKFCDIKVTKPAADAASHATDGFTPQEILEADPLNIAKMYYHQTHGTEMDHDLVDMMNFAIEQTENATQQ